MINNNHSFIPTLGVWSVEVKLRQTGKTHIVKKR